jgi:hypothetical protein
MRKRLNVTGQPSTEAVGSSPRWLHRTKAGNESTTFGWLRMNVRGSAERVTKRLLEGGQMSVAIDVETSKEKQHCCI